MVQTYNTNTNQEGLQLNKAILDPYYKVKWNVSDTYYDFLTFKGKLINNNLYRIGGLGQFQPNVDKYCLLLKYEIHSLKLILN